MVLLPLLALVGGAAAQDCNCYNDPTRGYWAGAFCTTCNPGAPLDPLAPNQAAVCNILDSCKDTSRPLAQRTCYGIGTCQTNNATMPCLCPANNAGLYCEKCIPGKEGWPACTTDVCAGPNATSSGTCNGHGVCAIGTQTVACGVTGGLGCVATAVSPFGCFSRSYTPAYETCVGLANGQASALTVGQGESLCGASTCSFGTKCADAGSGSCCPSDHTWCPTRNVNPNLAQNPNYPGQCCHPTATCCEGACCASSLSCNKIVNRGFIVTPQMVASTSYGGGPATEWKMIDGSTAEPWHMCSDDYLGAVATTRVIILPLCLLIAVLVSLILVWKTVGLNPVMVAVPAVLLVFLCIFLFFSRFWPTAIVITFGALFGMAAAHKGGSAAIAALIVEFFALAVVTGGLGLGQFFYANTAPALFGDLVGSHGTNWAVLGDCADYYGYFRIDTTNVPYDADPTLQYKNYCSEGWYTYLGLVADFVVMLQIIMLAATGVSYLGGSAGKSV